MGDDSRRDEADVGCGGGIVRGELGGQSMTVYGRLRLIGCDAMAATIRRSAWRSAFIIRGGDAAKHVD